MTRSQRLYLMRAAALVQRGTELMSRGVSRGEIVDDWEAETMNVLKEIDPRLHDRMKGSFGDMLKFELFGKADRMRALIEALDTLVE